MRLVSQGCISIMTTTANKILKCAVCGSLVECSIFMSTNTFGSQDLDLRPPEMMRSTMKMWLQECLRCRYVNNDVSKAINNAEKIIDTDEYKLLLTDSNIPQLARRFAQYSLLQQNDLEISGVALIRAAWACDDEKSNIQALFFRNRAADILFKLDFSKDSEEISTLALILVDVLRRSFRFDEARKLISTLKSFVTVTTNPIMQSILNYQSFLCDNGDVSCHTVADANTTG